MCWFAQLVGVNAQNMMEWSGVTLVRPRDPTCSGRHYKIMTSLMLGLRRGQENGAVKRGNNFLSAPEIKNHFVTIRFLLLHLIYFNFGFQWVSLRLSWLISIWSKFFNIYSVPFLPNCPYYSSGNKKTSLDLIFKFMFFLNIFVQSRRISTPPSSQFISWCLNVRFSVKEWNRYGNTML